MKSASGRLWVIATPIGNLSDISPRAVEAFAAASIVAAEDTRRTRKLLTHLDLSKPILRCDEAAEGRATEEILRRLQEGNDAALVSDAGTPGISDPGARLIAAAHEAGATVIPVAGPSAVTCALSASGFRGVPFRFHGFPARKSGARRRELLEMLRRDETSVFFESPHRIVRTLSELASLDPDRKALVARELTKQFEELFRGALSAAASHFGTKSPRGEFTVVLAPPTREEIRHRKRKIRSEEE